MRQQRPCPIYHLHNLKDLINNPNVQTCLSLILNMLIKLHGIKLMISIDIPLLNLLNIRNPLNQYLHGLAKPYQKSFVNPNSLVVFVLIYQERYLLVKGLVRIVKIIT